ncbi:C45 family autoproteolytic acyltransferase/hydrolase [Myxococcota bacterium]|nr:C45 family autoproteolytic acyltransferase/hydrolase [Myxococcota bacterium]
MRRFVFEGSPSAIGEAFGEATRAETRELYRRRVDNALSQAKEYGGRVVDEATLLALSEQCLPISEAYDPEGHAELAGIARGAGLTVAQVFAMNGLTDLRDVLAFGDMAAWRTRPTPEDGCSSFVVQKERTAAGRVLLGQTWDLATDNMPFVVAVERRPTGRPRTWSMTTVGCLSLIGLSEAGVAIGTTNIRTTDSRPGVGYLQIIHRALRETTIEGVKRVVVDAPRAGAHYYYAADATGAAVAIECTATLARVDDVLEGHFVHCNHILDRTGQALEAATPMASSTCRQSRMGAILGGATAPVTLEDLQRALADHDGGVNAICRHDYAGISSNGSMIMDPIARKAWVVHGPACTGTWFEVTGPVDSGTARR